MAIWLERGRFIVGWTGIQLVVCSPCPFGPSGSLTSASWEKGCGRGSFGANHNILIYLHTYIYWIYKCPKSHKMKCSMEGVMFENWESF